MSPEFQENIEEYFVQNIKVRENAKVESCKRKFAVVFSIFGDGSFDIVKCREILLTPLENTEPSAEQKQSDHLSPPRRGGGQLTGNSEPCRQAELWCGCQGG